MAQSSCTDILESQDFSGRKQNSMSITTPEMRTFNTLFDDSVLYFTKYTFNIRLKEESLYQRNGPHVSST